MESIFKAIVLGIVQGLTEFLPISSTAHLRIIPALFHWDDPGAEYSAVIQLGTMLAVVIYFWKDLIQIYFNSKEKIGIWLLLGTMPICVNGFLFKNQIESGGVRDFNVISFCLLFFGLLMLISDIVASQKKDTSEIKLIDVMLIGFAQCFALIPGVSRSAITIIAGLFLGFKRYDAAKFSFLLSIPAVIASGAFELYTLTTALDKATNINWISLIVGIVMSCISGYLAIDFLLKYLQKHKTYIFVIYRFVLGIMVLYLNFHGFIH